jgi:hypothetical protein
MKYLVNRETKEHRIFYGTVPLYGEWIAVEADAEGWIQWHGDIEWPLPDNCSVELVSSTGFKHTGAACGFCWNAVRRYRPILDKPEDIAKDAGMTASENYENQCKRLGFDPEQQCDDIISRLKSAHEAAQTIPDLLAELREVLGSMGYDVVARSPFVERTDYESGVAESESGT